LLRVRFRPVGAEGIDLVSALLRGRVLPFTGKHAIEGARLWNATGRHRRLRVDAMIAGAALVLDARLATANLGDFEVFVPHGFRLA
jgi:predicted nucleic acid-binding protein